MIHGLLVEFYPQGFLPFSVNGSEMLASRPGRTNVGRTARCTLNKDLVGTQSCSGSNGEEKNLLLIRGLNPDSVAVQL